MQYGIKRVVSVIIFLLLGLTLKSEGGNIFNSKSRVNKEVCGEYYHFTWKYRTSKSILHFSNGADKYLPLKKCLIDSVFPGVIYFLIDSSCVPISDIDNGAWLADTISLENTFPPNTCFSNRINACYVDFFIHKKYLDMISNSKVIYAIQDILTGEIVILQFDW